MDSIQITGLRAYGYTGFLPEEKKLGQWFSVDLTLWIDLSKAAQSDRIEDTHDYVALTQAVHNIIQNEQFDLIERLADAIAQTALHLDHRITRVKTRLTKVSPPVPNFEGQISVEIIRDR
ncbi:MAG: dihydroneopterin aldolase [Cyanobacteria bacterium P01_H01_bin.119]